MGQDSQETPNVASTSAASVREISILMTSAHSEGWGGGGWGGELSEQPQTYTSTTDLTWPEPAGFKPVSSGLRYLIKRHEDLMAPSLLSRP